MLTKFVSTYPIYNNFSGGSEGFLGGSKVNTSAWNAGDPGSIPGSGRSPGVEFHNLRDRRQMRLTKF